MNISFIFAITSFFWLCSHARKTPPHIILIVADDLGWNDVSFHGSNQILTPNIDALAYNGLILNQHYSMSMCTPSRAALLTGKYPIHTGMQHYVIRGNEPWGLGLNDAILPQFLSKAGYESHMVGKWHLGFYRKAYTPTLRGFKSHYGFWQSHQDYYNHLLFASPSYYGYDMRRNLEVDWSAYGRYTTDLFTQEAVSIISSHNNSHPLFLFLSHLAPHSGDLDDPFQAPKDVHGRFAHIDDPERRQYAGMVSKLDESVGDVVAALASNQMLNNSVLVFLSDNGAPTHGMHNNKGSNHPFRGMKSSAWEGGHRGVAAIWSPLLKKPQRVANQLMHITDWLPTLYNLAGLDVSDLENIDGINMWESLSEDRPSPRKDFVYNIDDVESPYVAFRFGDWKYVSGYQMGSAAWSEWYGQINDTIDVEYHPESVILSKTGTEITSHLVENIVNTIKSGQSYNGKVLHRETILKLRKEAEVECNGHIVKCDPSKKPCLFNLKNDPCEYVNLADSYEGLLQTIEKSIERYRKSMSPPRNTPADCKSDPIYWNNTWANWFDEIDENKFQFTFCANN